MQWLIGSVALAMFIILAFRFSQSRRALLATCGVIAILAAAATGLVLHESRQSDERSRLARDLIKPAEIGISDTTLTYEYGSWHLRGTLVNHSGHGIAGLTLHVSVQDCSEPPACKTIGEKDASIVGIDIAPRRTGRFALKVYLPDMPMPTAMKWSYEIKQVRAARQ